MYWKTTAVFLTHVESLSHTDSNAEKRAELRGFANKWKDASLPIYMSIYLDILSPLRRLSLGFQQELHDPVKAVRRIQDFTWTMIKLQILIENDLDSPDSRLTYYKRFIESTKIVDGKQTYQNIPLENFKQVNDNVGKHYDETIARLAESIGNRFSDIKASPVFENLVPLLDTKTWPKENMQNFGDQSIVKLIDYFKVLLEQNGAEVSEILSEWDVLKTFVIPIILNNERASYLEVWKMIFQNDTVKKECKNILLIFEIILVTPFTNAKVERMFSRMARVKTDWRN